MYINNSIKTYLDDLAAKKPAPGGGSAAALAGAVGVALISMVANFTIGKKKYRDFEADIKKILLRAESIRARLGELVDEDAAAYKRYSVSSKDDTALKDVLSIPLEICRLTHEALKLCPELAEKGNVFLVSDVGCAAELMEGAFLSAFFNIEINLAGLKDEEFMVTTRKSIVPLKEEAVAIKDAVCETVSEKMRGQ